MSETPATITAEQVRAIADRYAADQQSEREAADRRRLHSIEILEQVVTVQGWLALRKLTCTLCESSIEGPVNPGWFWVTRVPHAVECPGFVLAQIASEEPR